MELININELNLFLKIIVKYNIATKRGGTKKLTTDKLDILNIKIFTINGKYWFSVIFSNEDRDQSHVRLCIESIW